jgi:hypothetical protein
MKVGEIVEEIFGGSALLGGSAIRGSKAGPETTFWSNFGRRFNWETDNLRSGLYLFFDSSDVGL